MQTNSTSDVEINFYEVYEILINFKYKILAITFIFTLIGLLYSFISEDNYEIKVPIISGEPSVFIGYTNINDIFEDNLIDYEISSNTIFDIFVSEFNDYEELISILRNDNIIKESISDLSDRDKRETLIAYAKKFKLLKIDANNQINRPQRLLSVEWDDFQEGNTISNQAIRLTLENVKNTLVEDLKQFSNSMELKKKREIEQLKVEMEIIKKSQKLKDKARIKYLKEQAAIARELNIENNNLSGDAYSANTSSTSALINTQPSNFTLNITPNEVPYYLVGYKAIEKEISIIEERAEEDSLLISSPLYISTKEKLMLFESDISASQLRETINFVMNDDTNDWVAFDLSITEYNSLNRSVLYILISIFAGLMVGIIYSIFNNGYKNHKKRFEKV